MSLTKLGSFVAASFAFLSPSFAQTGMAVPPTEAVANTSQADWSRAWWQWAGSFNRAESPVADRSGENCHLKQNGPVWFLAGTYGTQRTIRTCKVPRGKYLFFPIINYVVKTLIAVVDWKLDPQAAVALPNNGSRNGPTELEAGTAAIKFAPKLRALGHEVRVLDHTSGLHAIVRTPHGWIGGADPRREGVVRGE